MDVTVSEGTLLVDDLLSIEGDATISDGATIEAHGSLNFENSYQDQLSNAGVLLVVGNGSVTVSSSAFFHGTGTRFSSVDASIDWTGLPSDANTTFSYAVKRDGDTAYSTLATSTDANDSMFVMSGLKGDADYNLRVAATYGDGQVIYDTGTLSHEGLTANLGWYRIASITITYVAEYADRHPGDHPAGGAMVGDTLTSSGGTSTANLASPDVPSQVRAKLSLPDAEIHIANVPTPSPSPVTFGSLSRVAHEERSGFRPRPILDLRGFATGSRITVTVGLG